MSTHNTKGTISCTQLTNPTSFVGKYAADGSWNIVVNDGVTGGFKGLHHPSGAFNAVLTTQTNVPFNAPNGSMYVKNNTQGGVSPVNPYEK